MADGGLGDGFGPCKRGDCVGKNPTDRAKLGTKRHVQTDGNGIPAPRIEYRLSENSQRMLEHGVARGKQVLEAAGAEWTRAESPLHVAGWHLMGTARMGRDPERSVVNEWGRSHDVPNLMIIDGSVFVTAGAVNPTCTIQAFALYAADRLQKQLADGLV